MAKNPRRVAAGRRNAAMRLPWTAEQKAAARGRIYKTKPWQHATGPRTAEGKAKASRNAVKTDAASKECREAKLATADINDLIRMSLELRDQ